MPLAPFWKYSLSNPPSTKHPIENDLWFMQLALEQAHKAYSLDEVPIGAIAVDVDGNILAQDFNRKESTFDPTSHAEIEVIRKTSKLRSSWRLSSVTLYTTLEPCTMCLSAMIHARIDRLVFGAYDRKGGSLSLGFHFYEDKKFNHQFSVQGGILHYECSKILSDFFRLKRKFY